MKCFTCNKDGDLKFTDAVSEAEYQLSQMCQECQDELYNDVELLEEYSFDDEEMPF